MGIYVKMAMIRKIEASNDHMNFEVLLQKIAYMCLILKNKNLFQILGYKTGSCIQEV